jgi:magnesium transporter
MYYQIGDEISEIKLKDLSPNFLTIGMINLEELEEVYSQFGFSAMTVEECKNTSPHLHGTLDSYYDYLFGVIVAINPGQFIKVQDRIGLYIKKNLILIVIIEDKDESTKYKLFDLLNQLSLTKLSQERLIFNFLERFINEDNSLLAEMEADISDHEDEINERKMNNDFNRELTEIRKKLIILDNYYQQFVAVGEELEENALDIFAEENLHYFRIFSNRALRLSSNTRMLQEYSMHVRESYHAQLDNDMNKTMKMFTVVTTMFLPLTLIVGWYGMNFTTMPELGWSFGYVYVILLSIIVAIICYIFFKKKKFM